MANTVQRLVVAGYNTALGIAQEVNYGVAVPPAVYLPFTQHNLAVKNNLVMSQVVRKSAGMPLPGIGTAEIVGDITLNADINSIGTLIAGAMGQASDVVTGTGPYTHTFKLKPESNSYTISADDNNGSVSQFVGCKIAGLDFSCKQGALLDIKAAIQGQTNTVLAASSLSPSFASAQWLEFAHLLAGASTINGTPVQVTDFSVSLKNKITPNFNSLGGRLVTGMTTVQREVTGTMVVNYDGTIGDLINTQLWGSASGPSTGTLPTNNILLTLTLPVSGLLTLQIAAATISEAPLTRKRGDQLQHQIKFTASESSTGAGDDLKVILQNAAAAAYS